MAVLVPCYFSHVTQGLSFRNEVSIFCRIYFYIFFYFYILHFKPTWGRPVSVHQIALVASLSDSNCALKGGKQQSFGQAEKPWNIRAANFCLSYLISISVAVESVWILQLGWTIFLLGWPVVHLGFPQDLMGKLEWTFLVNPVYAADHFLAQSFHREGLQYQEV